MKCRHCNSELKNEFLDLGFAPPSNAYLTKKNLSEPEIFLPLKVMVCGNCWLVQTEDYANALEIFNEDYAYFSSTSSSWLEHARKYVDQISNLLSLNKSSFVVEIASNDGYLLKNFLALGIPCLGIEPTYSTALSSQKLGIRTLQDFFSTKIASKIINEYGSADLIIGNNVYAHVPNINNFTEGLKLLLKPEGTITLEFPHLLCLLDENQFDTIYHEHFSYLSLSAVKRIFESQHLRIYDVEQLSTHGGSLRIYGCHNNSKKTTSNSVNVLLEIENQAGICKIDTYSQFQEKVNQIKNEFLKFLINARENGKRIIGYGAAAKGTTLLNYAGIKSDLIECVLDAAPSKQNKFLPGNHIPIYAPNHNLGFTPDYVIIFPWNLSKEIYTSHKDRFGHGTKFITAIPKISIINAN